MINVVNFYKVLDKPYTPYRKVLDSIIQIVSLFLQGRFPK